MDLNACLNIYRKPDETMLEIAKKDVDKKWILLHTLGISVLLNFGIGTMLFIFAEDLAMGVIYALYTLAFIALTAFSIPIIEYITYLAAKNSGGKGDYWKQLNITNHYLTLIFFVFFIFLTLVVWILPKEQLLFLDGISLFIVLWMNEKKIKTVHGLQKTTLANVAYFLAITAAYILWIILFMLPIYLSLILLDK